MAHDPAAKWIRLRAPLKYALPAELSFEATHVDHRDDYKLAVWGRFVGDDRLTSDAVLGALVSGAGIEEIVMHALYCDRFPLPAAYGELLRRLPERGDYELTHAGLAVKLARDHGCSINGLDASAFAAHLQQQTLALLSRASRDRRFEVLDVRYEALAILEDFLAYDGVVNAEIARVLAEQQPDAGWKPAADQSSAPHPTVMAVWALLAWIYARAEETTFARH